MPLFRCIAINHTHRVVGPYNRKPALVYSMRGLRVAGLLFGQRIRIQLCVDFEVEGDALLGFRLGGTVRLHDDEDCRL